MTVQDERTLLRQVTGALTYALDFTAGSKQPAPAWVRQVRDEATAYLRETEDREFIDSLISDRAHNRRSQVPGSGGTGGVEADSRVSAGQP